MCPLNFSLLTGALQIFLEKEMATHSSIPAWKIPWTELPGKGGWSWASLSWLEVNYLGRLVHRYGKTLTVCR